MDDIYAVQLRALNEQGQFKSAEFLGSFLQKGSIGLITQNEYANSLFGLKEYLRASTIYSAILEQTEKQSDKALSPQLVANIRIKLAKCHHEMKNNQSALAQLKAVSIDSHSVDSLMLYAKLCSELDSKRNAAVLYKEVLKKSPYCVEAAMAVAEIGGQVSDVLPKSNQMDYLADVLETIRVAARADYASALLPLFPSQPLAAFTDRVMLLASTPLVNSSLQKHPENIHLLLAAAVAAIKAGDIDRSLSMFKKIRSLDKRFVVDMDCYAWILKKKGMLPEIVTLCSDLMKSAPHRHEAWSAAAAFYCMKNQHEAAVEAISKATALGPHSPFVWMVKGELFHGKMNASYFIGTSYKQSWLLLRSIPAAEGLIHALFLRDEHAKAQIVANDVIKIAGPNSAKALTLLGKVLAKDPNTREQAFKHLEKALQLDSNCLEAVAAMAAWYASKEEHMKAHQILDKYIATHPHEILHVALGELYLAQNKLMEASQHFNQALSLNAHYAEASLGLNKVDALIRESNNGAEGEDEGGEDDDEEDDDDEDDDM